ncbi:MAG: RNA chaperone Hfq [Thermodesulfovibrionales bacterium]|nr:RNA chaperone Hfq [Thermodesulfovibrionales bacterium]
MSNSAKGQNLQDNYLNQLRKDKIPVVIYLINGVRLKGVIKGFDSFVVLLKEAAQQMIYKHAISTIVPERDIDLRFEMNNET